VIAGSVPSKDGGIVVGFIESEEYLVFRKIMDLNCGFVDLVGGQKLVVVMCELNISRRRWKLIGVSGLGVDIWEVFDAILEVEDSGMIRVGGVVRYERFDFALTREVLA